MTSFSKNLMEKSMILMAQQLTIAWQTALPQKNRTTEL
jgi:hypothetical protein